MKPSKLIVVASCLFLSYAGTAQLKLPISTPLTSHLRNDVQKVVAEYPGGFARLRGEVVTTNPQSIEYASLLMVSKAESCTITRHSSHGKPVYTWQAVMLTTESFEEAEKKYKWLFGQMKGMNVKYVIDHYTLTGKYESPGESRKLTTSTLTVADAPEPLQKLKVEVAMHYEFPEWKVTLNIFEKEREDDERGDISDL